MRKAVRKGKAEVVPTTSAALSLSVLRITERVDQGLGRLFLTKKLGKRPQHILNRRILLEGRLDICTLWARWRLIGARPSRCCLDITVKSGVTREHSALDPATRKYADHTTPGVPIGRDESEKRRASW